MLDELRNIETLIASYINIYSRLKYRHMESK